MSLLGPIAILEVPALLASGCPELWVTTTAPREEWAGATVLWSEDGDDFDQHQPINIGEDTVVGTLLDVIPESTFGSHSWWMASGQRVSLFDAGTLTTVDKKAAERLQTLASIGEGESLELIAFTGARLAGRDDGAYLYRFNGPMLRGVGGTPSGAHEPGEPFVRWDEKVVARIELPRRLFLEPSTVFLKVLPVNERGERQHPSDVEAIPVELAGVYFRRRNGTFSDPGDP